MRIKHLLLLVLMVLLSACLDSGKGVIEVITPEEMQKLQNENTIQIVDVRTPKEYADEYIANSQNIDFNSPNFEEEINKLDKSKPVVLYCNSGRKSNDCAQKLKDAGFVKIYDLKGGISSWKYEGYEIQSKS